MGEANYDMPLSLWVDFEYKHYLVSRKKERVGFLFYWSDETDDTPVLRLPVRTDRSSIEEILGSFCQGLVCYFALIKGEMQEGYVPDEGQADAMLEGYLKYARK